MNNKIANIVVSYLKDLDWVDKIAGLTQVARVSQQSGDNKIEKRFPISCSVTYEECMKKGTYDELAPNSSYKSVLFFEDGSFSFTGRSGGKLLFESRIRLVAWLNLNKIKDECGNSGDYVIDIIKALPSTPVNIDDMQQVLITVTSQLPRDASIFGKYTFNELQTQYLMYPYDFFALEIRTTFAIVPECLT